MRCGLPTLAPKDDPRMPSAPAAAPLRRLVLLAVAAEGLLTLMDALIKLLSARYPTLQIAFLRYGFGLVGAAVYAAWSPPGWPTREATLYNGIRAVLIVVTATSFFFALARLPLADAIAISFISPMLTAVLGATLLGERLDWRIAAALAAGFVGMLLIVAGKVGGGGLDREAAIGAAAVVVSAIGYALNIVMLRHRATRDPLSQIVLFQNLGPALLLAAPMLWVWTAPYPRSTPPCLRCSGGSVSRRISCSRMPSRASRRRVSLRSAT